MNNIIMQTLRRNLKKIFKEIQIDFPYYTPTNIDLESDKITFELNGFKYNFFCVDLKHSNVNMNISGNGFVSTNYQKMLTTTLEHIENKYDEYVDVDYNIPKTNSVFKQKLIMFDCAMFLYKKIKNKYPDKPIVITPIKDNASKIRIKYDDNAIFTILFSSKAVYYRKNNGEYISILSQNIKDKDFKTKYNVSIMIDSTEIDLKLNDYKSFYNNINYVYDMIIEPLSDDRIYFMDQKKVFKKKTNIIKKKIESSNFVRKMKINYILND